jgi:hypothetical protein
MPRRWKAPAIGAIRWIWPGQSTSELGRLVIAGGKLHRWPIPGAHRCIVESVDIDRDAGLAAALVVTLPFRGVSTAYQEAYERDAVSGWIPMGGGSFSPAERALPRARPSAARSGPAVLISYGGGSGGRSYLERLRLMESGRGPEELRAVNWTIVPGDVLKFLTTADAWWCGGAQPPLRPTGRPGLESPPWITAAGYSPNLGLATSSTPSPRRSWTN